MSNMTCILFSHACDLHAKFKARPGKNTGPKRCPFGPCGPLGLINFVLQAVLFSFSSSLEERKLMILDYVIIETQNKFYFLK